MKDRFFAIILFFVTVMAVFIGCSPGSSSSGSSVGGTVEAAQQRTYYYVGINHGHPYWFDVHQGLAYAAEQYGCRIVRAGPDTFDPKVQAEALEQAIIKNPDGIIAPVFDASILPGLKKAKAQQIPIIAIESILPDAEVLSYVGLDNYQSGIDTAKALIAYSGTSGNVAIMGNWGAANTDQKLRGVEDYLAANSSWAVIARLDDKALTETAIEVAKTAFNNYKDLNAIIGLDSSSGAGAGAAMEELNISPGSVTVIVHDREDTTLEYLEKGYLTATLINKSASQGYIAVSLLEAYTNHGAKNIPLSSDNTGIGINPLPEVLNNGTIVITKDTVKNYMHSNIPTYQSDLYK
jgi:ribose transport system substrate-binding protein